MRRALSITVAAVAAVAAVVTAPAVALAKTESAHSGIVSATFTFHGSLPSVHGQRLQISRSGTVFYDQPVVSLPPPKGCATSCGPGFVSKSSIHVLDLEHNGQPDVVLDLYSGGAHCCSIEQIFSWDPGTMTYREAEHNFHDSGEQIKDLGHNGRFELVSADYNFGSRFTDFADSGLPIQIWKFSAGRFTDVTRHYPSQIAKDAAVWLKAFRHSLSNGVGLIAAWAADEDLLGKTALVNNTLATEQHRGHLNGPFESGSKFVSDLKKFLHKLGYTH